MFVVVLVEVLVLVVFEVVEEVVDVVMVLVELCLWLSEVDFVDDEVFFVGVVV